MGFNFLTTNGGPKTDDAFAASEHEVMDFVGNKQAQVRLDEQSNNDARLMNHSPLIE